MILVYYLVFILCLFAVMSVYQVSANARRRKRWQDLARRLGLTYHNDQIAGSLDGVPVVVTVVIQGSGKAKEVFTRLTVQIPGKLPAGLEITSHQLSSKLLDSEGAIELGRVALDQNLLVRGEDPDEIQTWANQETVKFSLLRLATLPLGPSKLSDNKLVVESYNATLDNDELEDALHDLVALVRGIAPNAGGSTRLLPSDRKA
ncbi:MAG: hypothetical protein R3E66_23445 [bacterium]